MCPAALDHGAPHHLQKAWQAPGMPRQPQHHPSGQALTTPLVLRRRRWLLHSQGLQRGLVDLPSFLPAVLILRAPPTTGCSPPNLHSQFNALRCQQVLEQTLGRLWAEATRDCGDAGKLELPNHRSHITAGSSEAQTNYGTSSLATRLNLPRSRQAECW